MKLIGLTGGVGMGKTTAARWFQTHRLMVAETDSIARQLVEPGQPALEEIQQVFGAEILGADGRLQRDRLAGVVFEDPGARHQLEQILHPRIRATWQAQAEQWRHEGRPAAVIDIPLLFETHSEAVFDCIICVACSRDSQLQRLQDRGWGRTQIEQRLQAQWPVEQKMSLAHYVVWTEGVLEIHAAQLQRIVQNERLSVAPCSHESAG